MIKYRNIKTNKTGRFGCLTGCLFILMWFVFLAVVLFGWGIIITVAWNALFPSLLGWSTIEIYQGVAISVLLFIVGNLLRRNS
jgi:hypothetical protein